MTTSLPFPLRLPFPGRHREVLALAAAAALAGLALAHHEPQHVEVGVPAVGGWFGELAAVAGAPEAPPLSSSSLVVPRAALALPPIVRASPQFKAVCDSADDTCALRPIPLVAPTRRPVASDPLRQTAAKRAADVRKATSVGRAADTPFSFNPLDHLPDAATFGRPFEAAGSILSGWVKRL